MSPDELNNIVDLASTTPEQFARLRELAREAAVRNHPGHLSGNFNTCPHPDCVLVRASAPSVVEPATCQWEFDHEDDDLGNFITTCGETFCPLDSDPKGSERWLKFCCYCGKSVEFVAPSAVEAKEPQ